MTATPLVVGVVGSRRDGSYTLEGVRRALATAEAAGAETDRIDLGDVDLPLYHPDRSAADSGEAAALLKRVRRADAVVVGSPVYHGSYSSTFRNFHDYCGFDEYEDTVAGVLVVAGGGTVASTMDHLRVTLRGVHAEVIPGQVGVRNASDVFDADGQVTDPDIADRIDGVAEDVVAAAMLLKAASATSAAGGGDDD
jgi:NAD(P)H-dependent FMN reductase